MNESGVRVEPQMQNHVECLFFLSCPEVCGSCSLSRSRPLVLNTGLDYRLYFTYAEEMERFERQTGLRV